ncbi:MAG: hypothetical protein Q9191_003725 [Dirinaria sp. TL-2023a]
MEPLSPRAVNIPSKSRAAAAKDYAKPSANKEPPKAKEHAIKPPPIIVQPPVQEGMLSDKYRIGNHLGKGGFAVCYEGELQCKKYKTTDRVYALKVVPATMNHKKMEDKFRTELQIHAKLHHPSIVEFHRAFTFKDNTYVVLELCPNGSVMDVVKKRGCLSLPEVRRLTVQLCGAVKYMHARNVIHRDLKMGNLFLDHDMNLKLGDFGLAAVLVNKDEYEGVYSKNFSRRTTMCGTPNYIAPEILEKARGGHDHKVDIWAIGVILFAMLTGLPPFQATSQDEIYRKAKGVEYDWPGIGPNARRCHNDIPSEAKDLVARLLKVDAEARPNPDEIVGHAFFSMHNGNAMPLTLDPSCRRQKPSWLLNQTPRGDVMDGIVPRLELRTLAKDCGVGRLEDNLKPYRVMGENVELSLYKECVAEEHAEMSPEVPLPMDKVYTSIRSLKSWPQERLKDETPPSTTVAYECVESEPCKPVNENPSEPIRPTRTIQATQSRRGPIQSHAATLRAAQTGQKPSRTLPRVVPTVTTIHEDAEGMGKQEASQRRPSRRLLNELPVRPNMSASANGTGQAAVAAVPSSRVTRSTRMQSTPNLVRVDQREAESKAPEPDAKRKENAAKNEARIAANVQEEIKEAILGQRGSGRQRRARPKPVSLDNSKGRVLLSPDDVAETLLDTTPNSVRSNLGKLHEQLQRFLDKQVYPERNTHACLAAGKKSAKNRPVILKWVDYSHKFGVGYILENGTVGCILNGDDGNPPTYVAVAGAEEHLKKRKLSMYVDKEQIVPKDGAPIAFFEDCRAEGIRRVLVSPMKYQMQGSRGLSEELRRGNDEYDRAKRERLYLWDKFARYMTQSLGKGDSNDLDALPSRQGPQSGHCEPVGPFIRFYQRLGNVGIWGFGDGSFQINFPDHTKLILSPDGSWLDFYHLSLEAARSLRRGEMLEATSLVERSALRYPTDVMLCGSYRGHDFKQLIVENELASKLAFVKDVVGIWHQAGGLGCMGGRSGIRWDGMSEKGGKLVWVTVGAHGGDERKHERRAS